MGRPAVETRVTMPMSVFLCCWMIFVTLGPSGTSATDVDLYPELMRRIQRAMIEMERQQLRLVQMTDESPPSPPLKHLTQQQGLPQFTYSFPDSPGSFQSDLFAVPPSDPRYYMPESDYGEAKRGDYDQQGEAKPNEDVAASRPEDTDSRIPEAEVAEDERETDTTTTTEEPTQTEKNSEDVTYVLKTLLPKSEEDIIFVAIIAGCGAAAAAACVALTFGWYRFHSSSKAAADIEYPAYGVTGPNKEISPTSGDRRLAQSAQMYHYQHQKQQIIAMESSRVNGERRGSVSEGDSEEENEEGDYTVYECPGLAATEVGELEVKNPMFIDDPTPATNGINGTLPAEETPTADLK